MEKIQHNIRHEYNWYDSNEYLWDVSYKRSKFTIVKQFFFPSLVFTRDTIGMLVVHTYISETIAVLLSYYLIFFFFIFKAIQMLRGKKIPGYKEVYNFTKFSLSSVIFYLLYSENLPFNTVFSGPINELSEWFYFLLESFLDVISVGLVSSLEISITDIKAISLASRVMVFLFKLAIAKGIIDQLIQLYKLVKGKENKFVGTVEEFFWFLWDKLTSAKMEFYRKGVYSPINKGNKYFDMDFLNAFEKEGFASHKFSPKYNFEIDLQVLNPDRIESNSIVVLKEIGGLRKFSFYTNDLLYKVQDIDDLQLTGISDYNQFIENIIDLFDLKIIDVFLIKKKGYYYAEIVYDLGNSIRRIKVIPFVALLFSKECDYKIKFRIAT